MNGLSFIRNLFKKKEKPPEVHKHDWKFNCYMGRPAGKPKNYPMSEYYICACNARGIRHYGEPEIIKLNN